MKRDVGTADRLIRIAGGVLLLFLALFKGQVWGYIGVVPVLTGSLGWCPLYTMLGISTACKSCSDTCNGKDIEKVNL